MTTEPVRLSTRPITVDGVARLRDAIGYSGYVFDARLDGVIRRLAELAPDVVADIAAYGEAATHRGTHY